jgi:basic membrane protein A
MSKKLLAVMSLLIAASMLLSACGAPATAAPTAAPTVAPTVAPTEAPTAAPTVAPTEPPVVIKACEVTDTGGIDDKSFNATGWLGLERAKTDLGVEIAYLESQQASDYEVNLNAFIEDGCDLIIPVGFLLADATSASADINPDQKYAIVDVDYLTQTNIRGNAAKIEQATFLAGYLAAGMTKTGKIGTYVGILFPATQAFMDGYYMGMMKYNEVHGTSVELLGWDPVTQVALEVGNFESLDDGRALGEQLLDEGADIIMPVAGPVGLGTLAVMAERNAGLLIGVDNDWSAANPDNAAFVLASALKKIDVFVYDSVKQVVDGTFAGGSAYFLTLENEGVGLKYGSAWESQVPADLQAEVAGLIAGIVSGETITVPVR